MLQITSISFARKKTWHSFYTSTSYSDKNYYSGHLLVLSLQDTSPTLSGTRELFVCGKPTPHGSGKPDPSPTPGAGMTPFWPITITQSTKQVSQTKPSEIFICLPKIVAIGSLVKRIYSKDRHSVSFEDILWIAWSRQSWFQLHPLNFPFMWAKNLLTVTCSQKVSWLKHTELVGLQLIIFQGLF